jgi:hypothetical protein
VAALALAEQVAGAADLEVAHGDLEAGPQLGGLADRLEPLVGLLGEDLVARVEQVGVGAAAGPADAPPELVQLPEPEPVGAVDDEGVHRRHVDAGLDDRRAHEDVEAALPEVDDDLLERALVELAVGDGDTCLGHERADLAGDLLDVLHPVVDEEDLALAQQLAADGLGHGALVVLTHVGEDRLALGRRRVEQGEVRMPVRLISSVRGMGVADRVRTSTSAFSCFIASLWVTPKRCSSSTTSRPSFGMVMSLPSRRWVPMTTSTSPACTPLITARAWASVRKRLSTSTRTG